MRVGVIGSIDRVGRCWASELDCLLQLGAVTWSYFWVVSIEVSNINGVRIVYLFIAETVKAKRSKSFHRLDVYFTMKIIL